MFVLTKENASSSRFILKPTERPQVPLKNGTEDLENSFPFNPFMTEAVII